MGAIKTGIFLTVVAALISVAAGTKAQQPSPPMIIVQAANASGTPAPAQTVSQSSASPMETAIKMLEEVKAANAETLKKQEAMLQQLDELQKAAEQLKVFSKRT